MTRRGPKRKERTVFRSMREFKKHYLPNAYEREVSEDLSQDPKALGASLAKKHLEEIRCELERLK